jgi:hypothetical protein
VNFIRAIRSASALFLLMSVPFVAVPAAGAQTPATDNANSEKTTGGDNKAAAGPGASVSRVRVSASRVRHGGKVEVRGVVERRSSSVRLYFRPSDSKRWQRLKKVKPQRTGRYRTSVRARRNGRIRAVSSAGTASRPTKIRVRSRISVKRVRKYTPVGSRILVRGAVKPAGRRAVKVVIGGAGKVLRTKTSAKGGFSVSWRPGSTGRYRIRVFAAGNGQAASDSSRRIRVTGLRQTHASYFGPGLYGGALACGGRLYPGTRGVAHKSLPCGSKVTLRYRGRTVVTRVVDRGPFVAGREFDLTAATRNDLGFGDLGYVWTDR